MNLNEDTGFDVISPAKKQTIQEGNQRIITFPQKVQLLVRNLATTKQNLLKCQEELALSNQEHQTKEEKIKILEEKLQIFENDENQPRNSNSKHINLKQRERIHELNVENTVLRSKMEHQLSAKKRVSNNTTPSKTIRKSTNTPNRKPLSPLKSPSRILDFNSPVKRRQTTTNVASIKKQKNLTNLTRNGLKECSSLRKSLKNILTDFNDFSNFFKEEKEKFLQISEAKNHLSSFEKTELQLKITQQKLKEEENLRRKLHNKIIEEKGNIRVFCRIRPYQQISNDFCIGKSDKTTIEVLSTKEKKDSKKFSFDYVYPMDSTQQEVFDEIRPLITSSFDGYNVLIMTYGETSAGKTYTLLGDKNHPGVIQMSLNEMKNIFDSSISKQFKINLKINEIYNDKIIELVQNFEFKNFNEVKIKEIIDKGFKKRKTSSTLLNETSSRSHCIIHFEIESLNKEDALKSKLIFVDLAGSENCQKSGTIDVQHSLRESLYVNKSLSALGDVMQSLSQKQKHIPFRNSKLTHYLQDSLSGESKVLMLLHVSPLLKCFSETNFTLNFGSKVHKIIKK
eukprot:gene954-9861_t